MLNGGKTIENTKRKLCKQKGQLLQEYLQSQQALWFRPADETNFFVSLLK